MSSISNGNGTLKVSFPIVVHPSSDGAYEISVSVNGVTDTIAGPKGGPSASFKTSFIDFGLPKGWTCRWVQWSFVRSALIANRDGSSFSPFTVDAGCNRGQRRIFFEFVSQSFPRFRISRLKTECKTDDRLVDSGNFGRRS